MFRVATIFTGLILTAVMSATAVAGTVADKHSVAKVIKEKLSADEAAAILEATYDGFVEIRGKAKDDVFEFSKVKTKASYPDDRWEDAARAITEQVRIPVGAGPSSSRLKPFAIAYVFFYKDGVEGVNTTGAGQVNVTDGQGDTMALLVITEKAPKENVRVQSRSGVARASGKARNRVYKFRLDA